MSPLVKTLEQLQSRIERELAWRKREITSLRMAALASRSSSDKGYLFRAGTVLLCAHWEGFLKRALTAYIEHVYAQDLRIRDLAPTFVAMSFFGDVKKAASSNYPGSEEAQVALARRFLLGLDEPCNRTSWQVDTEANPGTIVLDKLLRSVGIDAQLGFDAAQWETMRVFIDEQILRDRHLVAHGEGFSLSRDQFLDRARRTIDLLDRLCASLIEAAVGAAYRHASPSRN